MFLSPHLHLPWLAPQPWVCAPTLHTGILADGKKLRHLLGKVSLFASKGQTVIDCRFHPSPKNGRWEYCMKLEAWDHLVGHKGKSSSQKHFLGKIMHERGCLQMQVSEHLVGVPSA